MFTGLVEGQGTIQKLLRDDNGLRITIAPAMPSFSVDET